MRPATPSGVVSSSVGAAPPSVYGMPPAGQASTGQRKGLLIGIILAHAAMVAEARGAPPMLLLDEPAVHLDAGKRDALFASLLAMPGPAIITGTDSGIFAALRGVSAFFQTANGGISPDP